MSTNCANREVYTVKVDSAGVATPYSTFTTYLPIPLRNVVKAELLMATILPSSFTYPVCHVYIEELTSNFLTRAAPAYLVGLDGTTSNVGAGTQITNKGPVERAFVTIPITNVFQGAIDQIVVWTSQNTYPTDVEYINPIRQLKTLTMTFYDATGALLPLSQTSYFIFRFECAKDNVCLY